MITGNCFVRDLGETHKDKKLFLFMGQLWVPAGIELKPEHVYKLIGSEYHVGDAELIKTVGLQILLGNGKDITNEARKKHPSQIVSLLHTDRP